MYKIFLGSPSRRFLKRCEKEVYDRIMARIKQLAVDPFLPDCKRVIEEKRRCSE